jgi:hypothetical protein
MEKLKFVHTPNEDTVIKLLQELIATKAKQFSETVRNRSNK